MKRISAMILAALLAGCESGDPVDDSRSVKPYTAIVCVDMETGVTMTAAMVQIQDSEGNSQGLGALDRYNVYCRSM